MNTTLILLNSISDRFPNGLGNDSGELGHNLMDHHFRVGTNGVFDGYEDRYYKGRRPNGFYIPRFRNIGNDKRDYVALATRGGQAVMVGLVVSENLLLVLISKNLYPAPETGQWGWVVLESVCLITKTDYGWIIIKQTNGANQCWLSIVNLKRMKRR